MMQNFEGVQKMGKTNMDAAMKSFGTFQKGAEAITAEITAYAKTSMDAGSKAMAKLAAVKTPDKAFEVQSEYAKAAYEGFAAQVAKLSEMYAALAKEAFKPYEAQFAKLSPAKLPTAK